MTYGTDAVIPLEVELPSLRTSLVDSEGNDQALEKALNSVKQKRGAALIRLASY